MKKTYNKLDFKMKKNKMYTALLGLSILSLPLTAHNREEEKKTEPNAKTELVATVSSKPMVTSFNGGFILSRVCLESMTCLSPYADVSADDYEERKSSLAGLVVFHLGNKNSTDNLENCGVFVWDGEKWQQISFEYTRVRK